MCVLWGVVFIGGSQVTWKCLSAADTVKRCSRPASLALALQWNEYMLTLASRRAWSKEPGLMVSALEALKGPLLCAPEIAALERWR